MLTWKKFILASCAVVICIGTFLGFGLDGDTARFCQNLWLELRYETNSSVLISNLESKSSYTELSKEKQTLYRILYLGAHFNEKQVYVADYDSETIWQVYDKMQYDSPELFSLSASPTITTTTCNLLIDRTYKKVAFHYNCSEEETRSRQAELKEEIECFKSQLEDGATDWEKAEAAHSWVMNRASYDDSNAVNTNNAYSALIEGKAACGGYAQACTLLMRSAGVKCETVIGNADPGNGKLYAHAWNRVLLDNEWKYLDVTWDDDSRNQRKYAFINEEAMKNLKHWAYEGNALPSD